MPNIEELAPVALLATAWPKIEVGPDAAPPNIEDVGFLSLPNIEGDDSLFLGVPNMEVEFSLFAPNDLFPPNIEDMLLFSCDGVPNIEHDFVAPKIDVDDVFPVVALPNNDGVPCLLPKSPLDTFSTDLPSSSSSPPSSSSSSS